MAEDSANIEALVARLSGGDQEALADLFSHYRDRLWRLIYYRLDHRLNGRVAPSDILQEAYLDAVERIDHYLDKSSSMSVFVWLRLIVKQKLILVHRHHIGAKMRDARRERSLDYGGTSNTASASLADHLVASLTSPSQSLVRAEALAELEKALKSMDAIDFEIIAMRHLEELSNNEVAEVLGITKAAASNRYVRALSRLKETLSKTPGDKSEEPS